MSVTIECYRLTRKREFKGHFVLESQRSAMLNTLSQNKGKQRFINFVHTDVLYEKTFDLVVVLLLTSSVS